MKCIPNFRITKIIQVFVILNEFFYLATERKDTLYAYDIFLISLTKFLVTFFS